MKITLLPNNLFRIEGAAGLVGLFDLDGNHRGGFCNAEFQKWAEYAAHGLVNVSQ